MRRKYRYRSVLDLEGGYAPRHAKIGKRVVFDQDDLDHWVDQRFADAANTMQGVA